MPLEYQDRYNLKRKTACVVDYGGYTEVAIELAKYFGTVLYFIEWREPFPTYHKRVMGTGIENVIRIYNLDDYEGQIDFYYFTDLFYGEMAERLRREGSVVFGAGRGERLELERKSFKNLMEGLGMSVNKNEEIIGIDALIEYLKLNSDVYVKLNANMRGHLESSHAENYELFKPVLDNLKHTLGWDADTAIFLVEKPIDPAVEYGYDGFFCGYDYPDKTMFGLECKDTAYCNVVVDYKKLPKKVKEFNEKLKPVLTSLDYRGTIGNEIRHKIGGEAYLLDIYTRQPQPPTSIQLRIIENFGEVAYEIALGIVPEIKFKAKYGCQLIIKSDWAKTEPQAIYFPEEYKEYISLKNLAIKENVWYYIPEVGCEMSEIGSISCTGNTLKEAMKMAEKISKEVKGYGIKVNCGSLDYIQKEIDKLTQVGINIF